MFSSTMFIESAAFPKLIWLGAVSIILRDTTCLSTKTQSVNKVQGGSMAEAKLQGVPGHARSLVSGALCFVIHYFTFYQLR